MYGKAGHAYIYFVYGVYDMLNIVTDTKDFPAAVLIRAAVITPEVAGTDSSGVAKRGILPGPGILTHAMHITRKLNGEDLVTSKHLYIAEDGFRVSKRDIKISPRIGIPYAGKHAKLPWRYFI